MKKRLSGTIAAFGLMVLFFTACGGAKPPTGAGAADNDGLFNPTGFPVVNRPVTLKVLSYQNNTDDYHLLPYFQELEELTGIHIEWEYITDDWGVQKALRLASGDNLPDIFFTGALTETDVLTNLDVVVQLDPLIELYAPNLRNIFESDPSFERFAKAVDGHIYGLPQQKAKRPLTYSVWGVNQVWLDALGLSVPTTTEELYQVLKAFKEGDPNRNGKADEIGISVLGFDVGSGLTDLFGAFGLVDSYNDWISVTDGRVQYMAAQDGFVDAISYFHRLWAEGLLDPETFSHDWGRWRAKGNPPAGEPDLIGVGTSYALVSMFGTRVDNYTLMMPLKGPKGHQLARWSPDYMQRGKYLVEISSTSQYPEIAMRWIDTLYDEDMSLQLYFGPYGERLEKRSDGTIYVIPPQDGIDLTTWSWRRALNMLAPGYTSNETNNKLIQPAEIQYEQKLLLAPYFPKEYYPMAATTPEEADELSILRQDIHPYTINQAATWVVNGGVEQEYPAFLRQIESMGLERMVSIYQTIYDRQK
jgi:putative aldouronate transport system substrate-binding protein